MMKILNMTNEEKIIEDLKLWVGMLVRELRKFDQTSQLAIDARAYVVSISERTSTNEAATVAPPCSTDFSELIEESKKYAPSMSLSVSDEGKSVELVLDTAVSTYAEWIPGEGGDICLLRCHDTKLVVGCSLPLMNPRLVIQYDGPIRINAGFRVTDCP